MGKRPLGRIEIFGWATVLAVILGFLFVTSWQRADTGPAPATTFLADTAAREEPMPVAVVPPAVPPGEAASLTPKERSDDGGRSPFSLLGFDSITDTIEMRHREKQREDERQAIRDAVASETIEESVRNLFTHDLSPLFSPHWRDILYIAPFWDAITMREELEADPRIAKLLDTIRQGPETEVGVVYEELRKAIDTFLNELPVTQPIGEPPMPTVIDPWSANALPLLLAAFPPSIEHLQLLVAMADVVDRAGQQDVCEAFPDRTESTEPPRTPTSTVLAYTVDQVLSGLADKGTGGETLSSEQGAVVDSYLQSREKLRALTVAIVEDRIARGLVQPEALSLLEDSSLLDSWSWRLAETLGRYKQPRETRTPYRREREVLAFAGSLCAAANLQPGGDSQ